MKKLIPAFFFLISATAFSNVGLVPADSFEILKSFRFQDQFLSDSFVKNFPLIVHHDIIKRRDAFFSKLSVESGNCENLQAVTFGPVLAKPTNEIENEFYSGLVRIESSRCYSLGSPEELIAITKDPNFKKRAFSTLDKIQSVANTDCEWTSAPMVGKSQYCYSNFDEIENGLHTAFTFLVSNSFESEFDAPVYLRQTITSSKKIGNKTVVYVVSYVRSNPMGSTKQFFAKGVIEKMQSKVFDEILQTYQKKGK